MMMMVMVMVMVKIRRVDGRRRCNSPPCSERWAVDLSAPLVVVFDALCFLFFLGQKKEELSFSFLETERVSFRAFLSLLAGWLTRPGSNPDLPSTNQPTNQPTNPTTQPIAKWLK
jgi:hypothetical protein